MWDKFGEFDSVEELNMAAAGQKAEGDEAALIAMAEENGIDKADAQSTLELVDSDGNIIITYTPELSYEYIILSSPEILTG